MRDAYFLLFINQEVLNLYIYNNCWNHYLFYKIQNHIFMTEITKSSLIKYNLRSRDNLNNYYCLQQIISNYRLKCSPNSISRFHFY